MLFLYVEDDATNRVVMEMLLLYELDDALARQLISMGCAREEHSQTPALVVRAADEPLDEARLTGGVRVVPRAKADDDSKADRRQGLTDRRKHPRTDRRKPRS